ncbi:MAG TPA: hypothetical protein VHZ96_23005 [Frankiaceae bacterium]|jgi:hypothetical protein|nr:hypothetical protein [Frankiaceae bacterium]
MTNFDSGTNAHLDLEQLTAAAQLLDRWTLRHLRIRLHAMEVDESPELDRLTDHAAHLSRHDRQELVRRVRELEPSAPDYDDELDYAEILANKNSLA